MKNKVSEQFKVINEYSEVQNLTLRTFITIECEEGHVATLRKDSFKSKRFCTSCKSKYYKSKEYNILDGIKQRCSNVLNIKYPYYGGKGVTICDSWLLDGYFGVRNFIRDMGYCPESMTIDRKDVNGNYEPSNCRWASNSVQGFNQTKRSTNTSGRTGVSWCVEKQKWTASITVENKHIGLGRRANFEDAVKLREEAELKYYGWVKQ